MKKTYDENISFPCRQISSTDKAVLLNFDAIDVGNYVWVARSLINSYSSVRGYMTSVTIPVWLAAEKGLMED